MIRAHIKELAKKIYRYYQEIHIWYTYEIQAMGNRYPLLNKKNRCAIREYWSRFGWKIPLLWHRMLYQITGTQTPQFFPESTFVLEILPYMRNSALTTGWGDKAYLDYHIRGVETAQSVLRNVSGRYIDKDFKLCPWEEAQTILHAFHSELVVKPAINTDTGKGVKLIHPPYDLAEIEREYGKNFVLQLPLFQHDEMKKLNSSSVNTIRVNSLLLDAQVCIMSAFVKVGEEGAFADNNGHNRFFIGIGEDGTYLDYAIDHDLRRYNSIPSGYEFARKKVVSFHEICETVKKAHKCIPHFGMAFWDICIKEDGKPAIVEVNLWRPNATIAQAATRRPFCGKYTDKVLSYVAMQRKGKNE